MDRLTIYGTILLNVKVSPLNTQADRILFSNTYIGETKYSTCDANVEDMLVFVIVIAMIID